jgi:catechol 2,3-dioxygenase-like lactoylglutathione lyase family enzyme
LNGTYHAEKFLRGVVAATRSPPCLLAVEFSSAIDARSPTRHTAARAPENAHCVRGKRMRRVDLIETEGLTHIHLYVADLDRSLRFYRDVFGLEEMFRDGPKMVFLRPRNSSDTITLHEVPERAGKTGGIDHFGFRLLDENQLDTAIQEVERAGGHLLERGERRRRTADVMASPSRSRLPRLASGFARCR